MKGNEMNFVIYLGLLVLDMIFAVVEGYLLATFWGSLNYETPPPNLFSSMPNNHNQMWFQQK
jgi:hypothetical protein